jgi:hypothetical protein
MASKTSSSTSPGGPGTPDPKDAAGASDAGERSAESSFDAASAQARIDSGEPIAEVAASYGTTARGLRARLTRAASKRDRLGTARNSLGVEHSKGAAPSASSAPAEEKAPPRALTPEEEKALADFEKFCTPRAIVDTIDGFQSSMTMGLCFLANIPLSKEQADMLPFEEAEKKGLEPWAAFATAGLSEEIRKDPSLGLKAFFVVLSLTLTRRVVIVAGAVKAANMRKAAKHAIKPSAADAATPAVVQAPSDAPATS